MDSTRGGNAEACGAEFPRLCKYFAELSPQPMIAVEGPSYVVRYANEAFCALVGKTAQELTDCRFAEIVPENVGNGCLDLLDRVLRTGRPETLADQEHAQATLSYWTYSMWPIAREGANPPGVMIQVTDVTAAATSRRQLTEVNQALLISSIRQHELTEIEAKLNEKLKAATAAKSQFLANMSHEIRTPLGAILGFCELLREPNLPSSEKQGFIDTINRNGRQLAQLIDDILDLSKIEAGRIEVETLRLSLPDLLTEITTSLSVKAREKGLALSVRSDGPIPETIESDPTRLRQILLNVIGNAIKFTDAGSVTVTVRLARRSGDHSPRLEFAVRDTGPGISLAERERLFSAFSQADPSTTRRFGGTGLGLVLARTLSRVLGGDLVLADSEPGKGSTFVVSVDTGRVEAAATKKAPDDAGGAAARPATWDERTLQGVSVLLADDSADNRTLIQLVLRNSGASVEMANDGAEAVRRALSHDYDLVLMDMQMPVLDGYEATRELRRRGYGRPIIALTAHAMREEREKSLLAGCNDHVAKPVNFESLVSMVSRYSVMH